MDMILAILGYVTQEAEKLALQSNTSMTGILKTHIRTQYTVT
jgi:hypothetical protein